MNRGGEIVGRKWRDNKLGLLGHVWCNVKGAKSAALLPHGKDGGVVKNAVAYFWNEFHLVLGTRHDTYCSACVCQSVHIHSYENPPINMHTNACMNVYYRITYRLMQS